MTQQTHKLNINENEEHAISQKQMIIEFLLTGYSLTVLDALKYFGCFALSQRITDLNRDGWGVQKRWKKLDNGKRIKQYYL